MLALLIAAALASPPPPIINGALEEGFPEAVAIGTSFGENTISICSGTLITERIILTAGHCGGDLPIELVTSLGVAFFGTDIASADAELRFDDYALHPDYVPLQNGVTYGENDVSILVLEEAAPVEPAWLRLEPLSSEEAEDQAVTSVGFGLNETGTSDGRKRSATLLIDGLDEMFLTSRSQSNPDGANICSGDSGGPQFFIDEEGRHVVWGVHSWGESSCERLSGSTRVDVVADWLLEQIERVHGTDDICEAAGRYTDGVCDEDRCDADPDCDPPPPPEETGGCATAPRPQQALGLLLLMLGLLARRNR
jgi:secreted trypsin-like serine protease